TLNGRSVNFSVKRLGDRQFIELAINNPMTTNEVVFTYDEGMDVYVDTEALKAGASNQGLRVLRTWADETTLHLTLEGLGARAYSLKVSGPRRLVETKGGSWRVTEKGERQTLLVAFDGPAGVYIRRELTIPLEDEE
ncbi:MAG TPA: hypothetical protein VM095_18600, partial [Pyrinomonadaceae bacterium]|nr:hypothetical protein [Pyrinomonadaceae bacterium]